MQRLKQSIALLLALIMVMLVIPTAMLSAFASVNPVAKATLITAPIYTEYKTDPSPDGRGWRSSPRGFYFENITYTSHFTGEQLLPKYQAYCIDHGGKFRGEQLDQYVGYVPKDSTYFMSFSETQQKGILLVATFGYPNVDEWQDLVIDGTMQSGDCLEDAVAATQALLWEFNLNTRTGFGLNDITDDWAYAMVKDDAGALRAYTRILASAQDWLDEGHNWESLLSHEGIVVWENGETAQVMLTAKVEMVDPFGSISIKKVDENGNGLEGAVFTIIYATPGHELYGQIFETIGPTSEYNNYTVRTGQGTPQDTVPYGTYKIVETTTPVGYKPSQKSWTVVVDDEHKHVQLVVDNLAERELKIHKTSKTTDGKTGTKHISDKVFFVYDYTTSHTIGGLIGSLTTDANGNTTALKLTSNESGQYAIKEAVTDNYTPSALNGYATKKIGDDTYFIIDKSQFAKNGNGVYSFTLDVVNEYIQYGKIQIKKELDVAGKSLKGFYFELYDSKGNIAIDNNTGLEIKGYTNDKGFLTLASDVKKCEIGKTIRSLSDLATVTYGDLYDFTDAEERAALEALGIKESDFVDEFLSGFTSTKALAITDIYFLNENIPTSTLVSWFNSKFSNNWLVYNLDGENVLSPDSTTSENDLWGLMLEINGVVVGMLYTSPFSSVTEFSVEPGEYTIKETLTENQKADYKSDADSLKKTFIVTADSDTAVQTVTFLNKSKSDAIKIIKTSEDGVLAGFKFKIEGPDGFSYITEETDSSGVLYINENIVGADFVAGEYIITEINVPGRYNTPIEQKIEFSLDDINNTNGVTKTVSFNNTLKTYQLTIKKESEDGIVTGIQFNVAGTDIKGNFIEAVVTTGSGDNADNTATLDGLYPGTYYITEIMTEDGRYVIPDVRELVITENSVNTVTFQNVLKKFTVELTKKPAAGAIYGDSSLEGAEYGLYKDGVLIESKVVTVTDGEGKITFSEQVCGEGYYVQEIKAPEGFYLDKNIYTVNADANSVYSEHNVIYVNVTDVEITGKITIYKLKGTEDNNVPEAGAIFHVYLKSAGAYIPNAPDTVPQDFIVTDREDPNDPMGYFGGIATTKELPYGTYIVKQVYGDERFELAEPFEVVINADHTSETYTVLNKTTVKPVTITKQDITGTKNLPGAELKLVDEDGNEYTGTTDENGQYVFTVWPAKSYTLTELVAPEGYVLTTEAVTFTLDIYGEVIEGSTVIKNEPNRVVVQKVDDEGNALSNATFECINADSGAVFGTADTNEDGIAVFECLPYGNYEIRETKCPAGYKLSDEVFEFTITSDWTNQPEGEYDFECINEATELIISKIDGETKDVLAGAFVEIYDAEGTLYASGETNADGQFILYNIVPGEYTFKEVKAPSSYELNTTVFSFTVTDNGEIVGETVITDKPNKFVVKKVNADGEALAGAVFQMVNDETGEVFATAISDENGLAVFESIPYGNYTIKETTPAPGYVISGEVIKVEITSEWINVGEGEFNSEYLNSPTSITFEKKDASTGEYVAGAEITVYDAEGNVYAKGTTDESGRYTIHNIVPGTYTWMETYAPAGYVLNETVFSFTISEDGEVEGDNVLSNTPVEVIISKTDITNAEPVPGAEITVYDADGNEIFNGLTDENGNITLEYLKPGKYTFKEIAAPAGYKLNTTVFEFEVTEEGKIIGTTELTNEPTEIIITKYEGSSKSSNGTSFSETTGGASSGSTNGSSVGNLTFDGSANVSGNWTEQSKPLPVPSDAKRLANATIIIVNEDGEVVHEGVTDENGEIKVQYLAPGKYTFYEVNAPEGYALNPIEYTFTIDENGEVSGTLSIVDELMRFRVYKVNELNQPMKDVEFTIYDENGDALTTVKTDEEGYAIFEGLKNGKYTIREVKTWDGYILATDSIKIEVDGKWLNGTEDSTVKIVNEPNPPQPGDGTNLLLWGILAAMCAVSLIAILKTKRRNGAF